MNSWNNYNEYWMNLFLRPCESWKFVWNLCLWSNSTTLTPSYLKRSWPICTSVTRHGEVSFVFALLPWKWEVRTLAKFQCLFVGIHFIFPLLLFIKIQIKKHFRDSSISADFSFGIAKLKHMIILSEMGFKLQSHI